MSLHRLTVPTHRQMLTSLGMQLEKGAAFSATRNADRSALLAEKLAPDMFPLSTQVRFACLQALECMDRLTGEDVRPADSVRDVATMEEAQALIEEAVAELSGAEQSRWANAETRAIEIVLPIGVTFDMNGSDYVRDWALPQFYFHVLTAYAIMRSHGVELGKADFVPHMFAYARKQQD